MPSRHDINLANTLTVLNALVGFISIWLSIQGGTIWGEPPVILAAQVLLLAILLDALDGRVARRRGGASGLGKELDSLADIVSFGVAPALFLYEGGLVVGGPIGMLAVSTLVIAGIVRLARFNVLKTGEYFVGLPIPAQALFFITYHLSDYVLPPEIFTVIVVVLALLMVSTLKYPSFKSREAFGIQAAVIAPVSAVLLVLEALTSGWLVLDALALPTLVAYVALGPVAHWVSTRTPEEARSKKNP
jgi:CDP-diacylglycerol--serine O-phosphatidyltransferase